MEKMGGWADRRVGTSKKSWKTDTSGRQFQRFFFGFLGDRIAGFNFFVFVRNE